MLGASSNVETTLTSSASSSSGIVTRSYENRIRCADAQKGGQRINKNYYENKQILVVEIIFSCNIGNALTITQIPFFNLKSKGNGKKNLKCGIFRLCFQFYEFCLCLHIKILSFCLFICQMTPHLIQQTARRTNNVAVMQGNDGDVRCPIDRGKNAANCFFLIKLAVVLKLTTNRRWILTEPFSSKLLFGCSSILGVVV